MGKISAVIQRINNDIEYKTYFFRKAPNYQNLDLWLKPLYDNNHLNTINELNSVYLEKVALENRENEKEEITLLLIKIIDNAITNRNKKDFREDWYILKVIFNLPPTAIKIDYIEFLNKSLIEGVSGRLFSSDIGSVVLPVLLENHMVEHLLELIKVLFSYTIDESKASYQERKPLVEKYWLFDLMKKHSLAIAKQVDMNGLIIVLDIMKDVIIKDKAAFNNIWVTTIEEHSQNSFPDRYDNQLVAFARNLLEVIEPDKSKDIVKKLLSCEDAIFKRLAFHTINYYYETLKEIFWQWFNSDENVAKSTYRHEYYKLVSDKAEEFSDEELKKVLVWIESLDYSKYYQDIEGNRLKGISAYRKKEWLLTIKEYYKKANERYEQYHLIAPGEIEHPGFDSWSYGIQKIDKTFNDSDDLCAKTIDEIAIYIKEFDPEKIEKTHFITNENLVEGLADTLSNCIKDSPNKFIEKLDLFLELDNLYKYHILDGFNSAWQEKQKFNWSNLFEFIDKILTASFFESQEQYKFWVVSEIAGLIQSGTKKDDNAFDASLLPQAKKILLNLIENRDDEVIDDNDWMHYVLNSPNGKVLHALVNYSLRYARLNSSQKVKWEDDIKNFFTEQLDKNDSYSLYVFTILGQYLDNLIYLDKEWVYHNFNKIFSLDSDKLWEVAIYGYFSYSTTVYKDTYQKFKDSGHINKSLSFEFKNDRTSEKIIQHICISYMGDFDEDRIWDVIKSKNIDNIIEIITFIWHGYRDENITKDIIKIEALWNGIFDEFREYSDDESQEIFSALSKWFVFINTINDENLQWLKLSSKYTEKRHNSYYIVEGLFRLVQNNPKYVGEIYLYMLENNVYPSYKEEEIISTISYLFGCGEKANAIQICNKYSQKGIYFLSSLFKEEK